MNVSIQWNIEVSTGEIIATARSFTLALVARLFGSTALAQLSREYIVPITEYDQPAFQGVCRTVFNTTLERIVRVTERFTRASQSELNYQMVSPTLPKPGRDNYRSRAMLTSISMNMPAMKATTAWLVHYAALAQEKRGRNNNTE